MAEKVTKMLIKVDLQCCRCHKKIKKILCKFPQIRDQVYDEKKSTVLITVVCCGPETIRQKIICKGGETVQSVEILPDKPEKPKDTQKPKPPDPVPVQALPRQDPKPARPKPLDPVPASAPLNLPKLFPGYPPFPAYPMVPVYPMVGVCCCPPGYGGYGGGPCYCGRRRPVMCYDGCGRPADACQGGNRGPYPVQGRPVMCDDGCGRPAFDCRGGNRGYYVSRCDYFSEENATGCSVM